MLVKAVNLFIRFKYTRMKKWILALVLGGVSAVSAWAQLEGTVIYETTVNIHKQLEGPRAEQLKGMLPETTAMKQQLKFTSTATLYEKYVEPTDVAEEDLDQGPGRWITRMMGGAGEDQYFTDLENGRIAQKRDFLGKTFLVKDEVEELKWKIMPEQKMIGKYVCQKAVLQVDTTALDARLNSRWMRRMKGDVVAWFTPQIMVPAGPNEYGQLPGLILEMELGSPYNLIRAMVINVEPLAEPIVAPTEGKVVTRDEFQEIVRVKMEEMRKERAANGGRGGRF